MFTGIIAEVGMVESLQRDGQSARMTIRSKKVVQDVQIGSSISVDGACLTVVHKTGDGFSVDISPETLRVTHFGQIKEGGGVNLEGSLRLGDRLDGHWVTGHVDGVGFLQKREVSEGGQILFFKLPQKLLRFCISKGSIAVDGISLTINQIESKGFYVMIIPHTLRMTTLGDKSIGSPVNIENDLIGKYVQRLWSPSENT